ncbi:6856_t:CDS:2, partial [Rhizophagus irregularis]
LDDDIQLMLNTVFEEEEEIMNENDDDSFNEHQSDETNFVQIIDSANEINSSSSGNSSTFFPRIFKLRAEEGVFDIDNKL